MNKENYLEDSTISIVDKKLVTKICDILEDAKTEQIKTIDISNKSSCANTFIIGTCRSSRHADATADELILKLKKMGINCPSPEGRPKCDWVLIDAGSIVIHLFRPDIREHYNLEKLWDMSFDLIENKLA